MEFMFEAAEPVKLKDDGIFEQVKMSVLDTESLCPRTNRRKIRAYLVRVVGVHPTKVKQAMRNLDLVQAPRRTLRELKDWMSRHAPEVDKADYSHTAWAVKNHPESPHGVLCGFRRRRVQVLQDAALEKAARLAAEREAEFKTQAMIDERAKRKLEAYMG